MSRPNLENLSLSELVELRDRVARELSSRYEQSLALLFTDVVGSTAYVGQHGDVAGRELLQRHHDLLARAMDGVDARVVDTAGDGAFAVAADVATGADVLIRMQRLLLESNMETSPAHRLHVRSGMHCGRVLVDENFVTGEAVHTAARVMDTGGAGEIRLSQRAFDALPVGLRPLCRRLKPMALKGVHEPVEILQLDWRDPARFATLLQIVETGELRPIPYQLRITLGRLEEHEGKAANDIVLLHPNESLARRISRWHADLDMTPDGYRLRAIGRAATEVDGRALVEGESALIQPGSVAKLGNVLTLHFLGPSQGAERTEIL